MGAFGCALDTFELRRLGTIAHCDPRTVAKVLRGETVRAIVRERIESALRRKGLAHLLPAPAEHAAQPSTESAS